MSIKHIPSFAPLSGARPGVSLAHARSAASLVRARSPHFQVPSHSLSLRSTPTLRCSSLPPPASLALRSSSSLPVDRPATHIIALTLLTDHLSPCASPHPPTRLPWLAIESAASPASSRRPAAALAPWRKLCHPSIPIRFRPFSLHSLAPDFAVAAAGFLSPVLSPHPTLPLHLAGSALVSHITPAPRLSHLLRPTSTLPAAAGAIGPPQRLSLLRVTLLSSTIFFLLYLRHSTIVVLFVSPNEIK
ncbi:hypothetical protein B0H13DRAFT_2672447 [Mycena leptocephala]|nr:hypothetical protein B0H13DRAFT_2672447 [Mycena leptocephala]